jgi:hypothetical protein
MSNSTPNRRNGSPPTSEGLAPNVQDFVRKPPRLLIDGEWVEAASRKTFETLNPATEKIGDLIEQHADVLAKDADMALVLRATNRAHRHHTRHEGRACSTPQCRSAATRNRAGPGNGRQRPR